MPLNNHEFVQAAMRAKRDVQLIYDNATNDGKVRRYEYVRAISNNYFTTKFLNGLSITMDCKYLLQRLVLCSRSRHAHLSLFIDESRDFYFSASNGKKAKKFMNKT
jgi:hypothetical protein